VYLGSSVTNDEDCAGVVKLQRTAVMGVLTKTCKNESVSSITKLRLMKALVWPVRIYRCDAWTMKGRRRGAFGLLRTIHTEVAENSMDEAAGN